MRNLKVMGLALIAVIALSAVAASAASAASYKSEFSGKTELTGVNEGNHTFQAGAKVVCTSAKGSGSFTSPATTISTSTVEYSGCTVAGQAATVNMNGCNYTFGEPTGSASPYAVKNVTIVCPSGKEIVITANTAGCTIKVAGQSLTETGTTATNNAGPPKSVTVNASITKKIKYTGSGGICGTSGTEGSYEGKFKVSGFTDSAHKETTGIFIS